MQSKVDFAAIVTRIMHAGFSMKWQARRAGYPAMRLRSVRAGNSEPPYGLGEWLLDMDRKCEKALLYDGWAGGEARQRI